MSKVISIKTVIFILLLCAGCSIQNNVKNEIGEAEIQMTINANIQEEKNIINEEYVKTLVENNLKEICLPSASSNPGDYIRAHQQEYDEIIKLGRPAVNYILSRFESSRGSGLDAWIAAKICCDILGEENPVKPGWANGRQWYEEYLKSSGK